MHEKDPETKPQVNDIQAAIDIYLTADATYPAVKKFLEEFTQAKDDLVRLGGVGYHFQGPDGRVHEVAEQKWKSVRMEPFTVNSTKRPDERAGSLSAKRAKELGYDTSSE